MPISKKRLTQIKMIGEEKIDTRDIGELGEQFFANAALTRRGESVIETVQRVFEPDSVGKDQRPPELL